MFRFKMENNTIFIEEHAEILADYVCGSCRELFENEAAFLAHPCDGRELRGPNKLSVKCLKCEKFYRTNARLRRHYKYKHPVVIYSCRMCQAGFPLMSLLREHVEEHFSEPLSCADCDESFSCKTALRQHRKIIHRENLIDCSLCDAKFVTSQELGNHERRVHSMKRYLSCKVCKKKFKNTSCLYQHKKIHLAAKNFKCELCGAAFRRRFNLQRHREKHVREQPKLETNGEVSKMAET